MAIQNGSFTDNAGNSLTSQANGSAQALDVGVNVGGAQVDPRQVRALTSSDQVTVAASALPTNASTSALQTTGNNSLASIDSKLGSVGQKAMSASAPVVIASDQAAIPVTSSIAKGTLVDRSGTTSSSTSTSTQIMAANASRKYLLIQNNGAAVIWINFTTAAVASQPSIQLAIGASLAMENSFVSTEAINVLSATASVKFTAKEA